MILTARCNLTRFAGASFVGRIGVFLVVEWVRSQFDSVLELRSDLKNPLSILSVWRPDSYFISFLPDLNPRSTDLTDFSMKPYFFRTKFKQILKLTSSEALSNASPIKQSKVSSQIRSKSWDLFFLSWTFFYNKMKKINFKSIWKKVC